MSKLLPFLVAGVGASSVSVGGVFMLKKTGGGSGSVDSSGSGNTNHDQPQSKKDEALLTLDTFKSGKGGDCVKSLFGDGGIDISGQGSDLSGANSQNEYFGTSSDATTKGCLIVHWKKETYTDNTDNNGKGTFTWTGSFVNGTKGFAFFGSAETKSPQKLEVKAGAYLFSKDNDNGTLSHKKEEASAPKEITNDNFKTQFPKAKLEIIKKEGEYGGFTTDADSLSKVCAEGKCTSENPKPETKYARGEWKGSSTGTSDKLVDWCDNFNGGDHIFSSGTFDINSKLTSFGGTGTLHTPQQ